MMVVPDYSPVFPTSSPVSIGIYFFLMLVSLTRLTENFKVVLIYGCVMIGMLNTFKKLGFCVSFLRKLYSLY